MRTEKKQNKLQVKDFITAGIFSALSFLLMLVAGVANLTPQSYLFYPAIFTLINGPVFLIVVSKIKKTGAIFLFHIVPFFYLLFTGVFGMVNAALILVFCLIAEFILKSHYTSKKHIFLTYLILCNWMSVGSQFEMFVFPDLYCEQMSGIGMDSSYVETIRSIGDNPVWWAISILATLIMAFIGIRIGYAFMKKHLIKAGIVD